MYNYSACTGLSFLLKAIRFTELMVHVFLNTRHEVLLIVRLYLNYFSRCRFENIVSRLFCTGISHQYIHVPTYSVLHKYYLQNLIISISILGYRHLPYSVESVPKSTFNKDAISTVILRYVRRTDFYIVVWTSHLRLLYLIDVVPTYSYALSYGRPDIYVSI